MLQLSLHFAHGFDVTLLGADGNEFHASGVVGDLDVIARRIPARIQAFNRGVHLLAKAEAWRNFQSALEPQLVDHLNILGFRHDDRERGCGDFNWNGEATFRKSGRNQI